ncbi:MAG: deoxyribose-phosphate aldolase [Pseudomonadota bacterium]
MAMVLLRHIDDRFQADLWCQALDVEGIPHRLRTWEDSAYDGLFVLQRGYASLYVEEADLARARQLDQGLMGQVVPQLDDPAALARAIDHTLLDPGAGQEELEEHLRQCLEMRAAAACLAPWMVPLAAPVLAGSQVALCAVVGFPLGTHTSASKLAEALELAELGAVELDVVINRGLVASGQAARAVQEVAAIARALPGCLIKVILESAVLGPEISQDLARRFTGSGVGFLKTGSGYFGSATVADVQMLLAAAQGLGVKAAGGIRDLDQALALLGAGAERLGTSHGHAIWRQAVQRWREPRD